jgi:muramidase (phage lysozyme)
MTEQSKNLRAFLGMIAVSEVGPALMAKSEDGYKVLFGATAANPLTFSDYHDHPRKFATAVIRGRQVTSSAAGRYQILARYFDAYKGQLGLKDFSPASQDAIAIQLIRECRALPMIAAGEIEAAIDACKSRWASLPGANYQQNEQKMAFLVDAYKSFGGEVA